MRIGETIFVFLKIKKSFLKSSRPSLPLKKETFESLRLPLAKGSSTFLTKPLFPQEREDVTALRCSEPLRYKVGGPSKVYARLCGMGPHGEKNKYLERQVINGKSPYLLFRNLHILWNNCANYDLYDFSCSSCITFSKYSLVSIIKLFWLRMQR